MKLSLSLICIINCPTNKNLTFGLEDFRLLEKLENPGFFTNFPALLCTFTVFVLDKATRANSAWPSLHGWAK